jgi:hypothetical protein
MIVPDSEYLDFSQVPKSAGIPSIIVWSGIIGLIAIFAIGGSVILNASSGHHWPATSTMRVDLGTLHE